MTGGPILFDDAPRMDRVVLALGPVDSVTGTIVRNGVTARILGLPDKPIVNASGLLVFLNLPEQPRYEVEVDGRRAGFPFVERFTFTPPAAGNKDPAGRRRDVLLAPGPDYPFPRGTTLVRGVVVRGGAPVSAASISAMAAGWSASFTTHSAANGAFALAVRLPALGAHGTEAPVKATIMVTGGSDARSFVRPLANGRSHILREPIDLTGSNDPAFTLA